MKAEMFHVQQENVVPVVLVHGGAGSSILKKYIVEPV